MMRIRAKGFALMSIFALVAPAALRAADTPADTANTASPAPPKPHHRHKATTKGSAAADNKRVTSASANVANTGTVTGIMSSPGMPDNVGANNAGAPNMGSPDHTPGTTGTSGQ